MPCTYGCSTTEERASETIAHILNSNYPFLDTSRNYGDGRNEERIGKFVAHLGSDQH